MDWDDLAPLTNEQSQSISQLQQLVTKFSPIVPDIDKSQLNILEPSELSSLPSNHKLRQRYKQIQFKLHSKHESIDEDDDEFRYRQRAPKLDYIEYFMEEMSEQRNTALQLTSKLKYNI